jgi:hypothetical protein
MDEAHNLNLDTRAGEDLSDHLKYFICRPRSFTPASMSNDPGCSPAPGVVSGPDAAV